MAWGFPQAIFVLSTVMNLKYLLGVLLALPLSPLMYYQGKKIKASLPDLPEATQPEGFVSVDGSSQSAIRLLCLGESTIAGVGVKTHQEGFTGSLARELAQRFKRKVNWKVFAKSGFNARQVHKQLLPIVEDVDVDIIVVGLGGNDAFELNSPGKWRKDVQQLIEKLMIRFPGAPIVFCNMPPIKMFPAFTALLKFTIGNLVELLGHELNDLVQEYPPVFYNQEIITLENWSKKHQIYQEEETYFCDGVHPSKLTYQVWAKEMAQLIETDDRLKRLLLEKINS
ncbi:MAG: SGNH/GDSL hydrolase family protein [Bacteroidota bacterium]